LDWVKSARGFLKRNKNHWKRYHSHMTEYILSQFLRRTLRVFDVEHSGYTLNAAFIRSGIFLNGTADMLIVPLDAHDS
jgi:hypothetical protein